MRITILKTKGKKLFNFEKFNGGFWIVFNIFPGKLGVYLEIEF